VFHGTDGYVDYLFLARTVAFLFSLIEAEISDRFSRIGDSAHFRH
jgi:hypothetical protein